VGDAGRSRRAGALTVDLALVVEPPPFVRTLAGLADEVFLMGMDIGGFHAKLGRQKRYTSTKLRHWGTAACLILGRRRVMSAP
jgi:hypothetical protein